MKLLEYVKQFYKDDLDRIRPIEGMCPSDFGLVDDCEDTINTTKERCEKCWGKELLEEGE